MTKLNFQWEAIFRDGIIIPQFEEDKEHLFSEVKEKFSDLVLFKIKHINLPLEIAVDLTRGLLFYNLGQPMELYEALGNVDEDYIKEKKDIRLIFFRRHKQDLNSNLEEIKHEITYFIGYQYLDSENHNKKVNIKLNNTGNLIIGD